MDEDDWDTEVAESQDKYNLTNFANSGNASSFQEVNVDSMNAAYELEKEEELEKKELEQAKSFAETYNSVSSVNFTAERNAKKKAGHGKIMGNSVKLVPTQEDEVVEVPQFKSVASAGGFNGQRLKIQDPELAIFFEESENKIFSEQAKDFLNAYWPEVGSQAEFIFAAAYRWFVAADMHTKGIALRHLYEEGKSVDYNVAAYFYEKLYHWLNSTREGKKFRDDPTYAPSMLKMKTAIELKKDFREKVDVSFDGKISFLEHLLYQYNTVANPQDFMKRRKAMDEEHEVIVKARLALEAINEQIKLYEKKRAELEEGAKAPGVKGLTFKHQLSMLDASPLAESLQQSLITAEAAVRIAVRHYKGKAGPGKGSVPEGSLWWMERELKAKKEVVVPNTLRRK